MKIITYIICLLIPFVICNCKTKKGIVKNTAISKKSGQNFLPYNSHLNDPDCMLRFLMKLEDNIEKYDLIGICASKKLASGKRNIAIGEVQKCGCQNGGQFARIIDYKETEDSKIKVYSPRIPVTLNLNSSKTIKGDYIKAEIYKLKTK